MAECADTASKIECRSKRAVTAIIGAINEHIEQIISGNNESSFEDKERCRLRFREIYETALQQNVLIDGEEWSQADSKDETSEFEPVDVEKKNFINDELVPNLDSAIVRVARKRKFHPRFCEEEVYEAINKNAYHLAKIEVKDDEKSEFAPNNNDVSLLTEPELKTQLQRASFLLGSVTKTVTSSVENAQKLKTAVSIFKQPSETDKVIFDGDNMNGIGIKTQIKTMLNGTLSPFISSTCEPQPSCHQDFLVEL